MGGIATTVSGREGAGGILRAVSSAVTKASTVWNRSSRSLANALSSILSTGSERLGFRLRGKGSGV